MTLFLVLSLLPAGAEPELSFRDVTSEVGLREPLVGFLGHGGAWGDIDGDGWPDLFGGTYNLQIDGKGERLYFTFNGAPWVNGAKKVETFGRPSVVVVTVPAVER